jgi:hypothetical protein
MIKNAGDTDMTDNKKMQPEIGPDQHEQYTHGYESRVIEHIQSRTVNQWAHNNTTPQ